MSKVVLSILNSTFRIPAVQRDLAKLYSLSQLEYTKNGRLCMEIGMARERDQCAVLQHHLGGIVDSNVDNSLPEDVVILGEGISIKHLSSKVGTPIVVKWSRAADLEALLYPPILPHYLLTYIKGAKISIVGVHSEEIRAIHRLLGVDAFKYCARGTLYSSKAMKLLIQQCHFKVDFDAVELLADGLGPIERRLLLLKL